MPGDAGEWAVADDWPRSGGGTDFAVHGSVGGRTRRSPRPGERPVRRRAEQLDHHLVGGHLEAHGASGTGIVDFSPPTGQSWAAGTYDIAAAADATHAGFQLSTGGGVCPTSSGTLHVVQVSMSGSNFTSLAADYSARCGLGSGPAFGVIRWNSAIGYAVGTADPGLIEMGDGSSAGPARRMS